MLNYIELGNTLGINPENFYVCSYMNKYQLGFEELVKFMIFQEKTYSDMEYEFVSAGLEKMQNQLANLDVAISNLFDELKRLIETGCSYMIIAQVSEALNEKTQKAAALEAKIAAVRKDFPNL